MSAGLGPGAGVRREDEGVLIACEETVTPAPATQVEPRSTEDAASCDDEQDVDDDVDDDVDEWSSDATTEEVTEAWRRVLLQLGASIGEKKTDRIIRLVRHPSFCTNKFSESIYSVRKLREAADRDVEQTFEALRFQKKTVVDEVADGRANMWLQDPVDVVRRQVAQLTFKAPSSASADDQVKVDNLYTDCFQQMGPDGDRRYSHPMSTDLAASVFSRVRCSVFNACAAGEEGVVGWRDGYDFVLLLQAYSDKSRQTLKTASQTHFPFHVAIVNTSLSAKEKLICAGDSVVGYMPTSIKWGDEQQKIWNEELADAVAGQGSRESRMRILQSSIETCLDPLLSQTLPGFTVVDSRGVPKRCHPVLWSYVTDLPEGWDVSSSIHHRCARCHVHPPKLNSTKPSKPKECYSMGRVYDDLDKSGGMLKKSMQKMGFISVRPFLLSLGENFGVDMYQCLRYEVMHGIHHGLTRTLLRSLSVRLRTKKLRSPEFPQKGRRLPLTFNSIRTRVLKALNRATELYDRQSPTIDFKVSHRIPSKTEPLNGLFTQDGLASMLEAKHYVQILQVMPFLAATCDRLCGEPGTTTRLFVQYVELVYTMLRLKDEVVAYSAGEVDDIQRMIRRFIKHARRLYGEHTRRGMAIPKMHALLHVGDDMLESGALSNNRSDAFEFSHRIMRNLFEGGSKRKNREMGQTEALGKMTLANARRVDCGKTDAGARIAVVKRLSEDAKRTTGAPTKSKMEAAEVDGVAVSRPNAVMPASAIQKWMADFRDGGDSRPAGGDVLYEQVSELASDLGRFCDFEWFMNKLGLGTYDSVARSASAQVPGFPYPELVKSADGSSMLVCMDRCDEGDAPEGTVKRYMQRAVASHSFYGSEYPVQMFAMIETGDVEATTLKLHRSERGKYASCKMREVSVVKVLAFLTVRRNDEDDGPGPKKSDKDEVALIQYLDVCQDEPDEIEDALGCVKLKWAQELDDDGTGRNMDGMRCHYDVVDVGTLRGVLHVLRGDYGLGESKTYSCEGDRHWADCWFYINRFKIERRGARVFIDAE